MSEAADAAVVAFDGLETECMAVRLHAACAKDAFVRLCRDSMDVQLTGTEVV